MALLNKRNSKNPTERHNKTKNMFSTRQTVKALLIVLIASIALLVGNANAETVMVGRFLGVNGIEQTNLACFNHFTKTWKRHYLPEIGNFDAYNINELAEVYWIDRSSNVVYFWNGTTPFQVAGAFI